MEAKFVDIDTPEYQIAREIRYRIFFKAHNLPSNIIFDDKEATSFHGVIIHNQMVLAYGRLTQSGKDSFQISQMVVEPEWQKRGLGATIIKALIEKAENLGARTITLDARTHAIRFYRKFGFEETSDVFPSKKTGVPHVFMKKRV